MKRRKFIGVAGVVLAGAVGCPALSAMRPRVAKKDRIKPKALQPGARVMMIAPASSPGEESIDEAIEAVTALGYEVVESPNLRKVRGFLAGTDEERLSDFHLAWSDSSVDGIWCVRGGYGSKRLLPRVRWDIIQNNPKVFIGYSDITALHNAIFFMTGLTTFHGPVGTSDYTSFTKDHLRILTDPGLSEFPLGLSQDNTESGETDPDFRYKTIREGEAIGQLVGGNLSLLASMCGSPWLPSFAGKIVFLEDVGEHPYRIDGMFTQLLHSTDISEAAGIVHGIYNNCAQEEPEKQDLEEVIFQTLGHLPCPQGYGFSFGHIADQVTLPMGIYARMDSGAGEIRLLEPAVL